jgi:hypothetical protein
VYCNTPIKIRTSPCGRWNRRVYHDVALCHVQNGRRSGIGVGRAGVGVLVTSVAPDGVGRSSGCPGPSRSARWPKRDGGSRENDQWKSDKYRRTRWSKLRSSKGPRPNPSKTRLDGAGVERCSGLFGRACDKGGRWSTQR